MKKLHTRWRDIDKGSLLLTFFPRPLLLRQLKLKKIREVLRGGEFDVSFALHESPQNGMIHARPDGYRIPGLL